MPRYLDSLEAEGFLDRELEFLPSDKQIAERQSAGSGLCTPEFAVMIAYTKNADITEVLETDLPDDPALDSELLDYFPSALRERFPDTLRGHRLRREIITTSMVNTMVNLAGISFDHRMTEDTGSTVADVLRAFMAARRIVELDDQWDDDRGARPVGAARHADQSVPGGATLGGTGGRVAAPPSAVLVRDRRRGR